MLEGKYDPHSLDAAAQALWEAEALHRFDRDRAAEVYSIDTPPPTVSGAQHIGHVFSYTQAECIARYQRMRGKNVFYPFGFDDNGLPTERLAEKEHGVLGREMPREAFVALCRETSAKYKREFEALWRSLGFSADWSLVYSTIDERSIRISQRRLPRRLCQGRGLPANQSDALGHRDPDRRRAGRAGVQGQAHEDERSSLRSGGRGPRS